MKKAMLMLALVAFGFSTVATAQETPKKKEKAKTEKSCSTEKKGCDKEKKAGCCAAKKAKS
ncbi:MULTISPECIES: hypothetical protein [unclassified Flavobacterium]|uniref:hypothetical protein n=1 Tax=unclassified Flavobacterium TaxID=196869 RepID=UPI001F130B65|nr:MULTISPECIES: hypothetical protein [unclassified Flavobacterium]UMY67032.1 hypothetical protein MKO97_06545 [Flavobacterium sp. HJ-32-4]